MTYNIHPLHPYLTSPYKSPLYISVLSFPASLSLNSTRLSSRSIYISHSRCLLVFPVLPFFVHYLLFVFSFALLQIIALEILSLVLFVLDLLSLFPHLCVSPFLTLFSPNFQSNRKVSFLFLESFVRPRFFQIRFTVPKSFSSTLMCLGTLDVV